MNLAQAVNRDEVPEIRPQFARYVAPLAELLERGLAHIIRHERPPGPRLRGPRDDDGFIDPRLAAAIALLAALGGLTIWALLERSGRLGCEVRAAEFEAAYGVLAETTKRQSAEVSKLEAKADAARAKGRQRTIAAAAEARLQQPKIDALGAAIAAPAPAAKGCREALDEIRRLL